MSMGPNDDEEPHEKAGTPSVSRTGELGDAELLEKWRAGDRRAGNVLLKRHFNELYGFFRNKVDQGVEDLVQRTMLACVEGSRRIETSSFRAYMFGAAWNIFKADFKKRCHERGIDPFKSNVANVRTSVTEIVAKRREHRLLLMAMQRIPLEDQVLLELWLLGHSAKEISSIIEKPAKRIPDLTYQARTRLREAVAKLKPDVAVLKATLEDLDLAFGENGQDVRGTLRDELLHGEASSPAPSA
jgi:RNA polymerase sigma factor (sigma-70 family)